MWFTIASKNNIQVAKKDMVNRLKIKMSEIDIEYAVNQAYDWIKFKSQDNVFI